jgi:hypothetical protein
VIGRAIRSAQRLVKRSSAPTSNNADIRLTAKIQDEIQNRS